MSLLDNLKKLLMSPGPQGLPGPRSNQELQASQNQRFNEYRNARPMELADKQPIQPMQRMEQPEITYNPNRYQDIPYSAHTVELAQMGNRYKNNPTGPEFRNIDPGLFGYPADGPGGVNPNRVFRGSRYQTGPVRWVDNQSEEPFDNIMPRNRY